ncbi:hypothetical protein KW807_02215, partial [Candidatus Parcubacteria bacterium]|nr:hypothetical protein [Candidatus Parcubacteria bacterium]
MRTVLVLSIMARLFILDWIESEVKWDWRPGGVVIRYEPANKSYRGMLYLNDESKILIWFRPKRSVKQTAADLVHELAHMFAETYLGEARRQEWYKLRGLPADTEWSAPETEQEGEHPSNWRTGEEDFAECIMWT